jgi:putative ABC transport system ATP-binding protein
VPILEARSLTKTYRLGEEKVVGVVDASITLERQSFAVLAGPSGSGKTTLLNLLGLLDTPDAGALRFEGSDVAALDERGRARIRRERLGFVFQAHQLVPVLSAEDNVSLALWIRKVSDEECRTRARAALAAVGLGGLEARRPDSLSGGQRQRVAVARAIVGDPALVLADEPTASLDSETASRLIDLFARIHEERGVAFLFSSHDPRIVERADRRIRLLDGRITADERVAAGARA